MDIILLLNIIILISAPHVYSARILGIFSFPAKSHFMMIRPIMRELTFRGHEVTMIANFPMNEELSNYTEILIEPRHDIHKDVKDMFDINNLYALNEMPVPDFIEMLNVIGLSSTEYALKFPRVQEVLRDNNKTFDLLIVEQFYQEAFLTIAHKYKIPIISIGTMSFQNYMSQMMGVVTPWSYVPHGFLPYTDKMNFFERLMNSFYSFYEDYDREYNYLPKQDKLVKKYLSHIPGPIPSVSELARTISVILLNSYFPITTARPIVPGIVQVGGIHIEETKPLPRDIKKFLDEAKNGVIYFSLGTNLKISEIPPKKLQSFLMVFGRLSQKILWKCETEDIHGLPDNVMVKTWLPQNDILAHPNVKVFITHGGLLGTQEGVYHGVPMLGIPVYCDQHLNMNRAVKSGYAISLHYSNITEESLQWALNEMLYNPTYSAIMRTTSQIFRDRSASPLETAMYWIEYIIRYKGAPHIRSAGLELSWFAYYLVDIMAFLFSSVLLILAFVIILVKYCFRNRFTINIKEKNN